MRVICSYDARGNHLETKEECSGEALFAALPWILSEAGSHFLITQGIPDDTHEQPEK